MNKNDHDALREDEMSKLPFYDALTESNRSSLRSFLDSYEKHVNARHREELESIAKQIESPDLSMKYCGDECIDLALKDAAAIVRAWMGV